MDRDTRNTARSAHRSNSWRHQTAKEHENIANQESVSNAKPAWRKVMDESISAPPTYERQRRPYRWSGDPNETTQPTNMRQAAGAPPPPPPGDEDDDNGEPWDRRNHPSRHYGGGGGFGGGRGGSGGGGNNFPNRDRDNNDDNDMPPNFEGGFGGGGGPPNDPDDGQYDDRESENSEGFPHYAYWPPYGIYYRTKPPAPDKKINATDYYGMPYYHYHSGWPQPQEYHYTR
jgi:hypothetical protein